MKKLIKIFLISFALINLISCASLHKNSYCVAQHDFNVKKSFNFSNDSVSCDNDNDSYKVFGKTYHVLKSSKNYQEKGNASWYGKKFNHKRTFSGERFNMLKMTAAHRTLPMSTRVLVTNLLNGKQVIVRVNDRGPFVDNRLIDLSYMAAKKIGMLGHGIVPVKIKALSM